MSEEIRFEKNKKVLVLSISLVTMIVLAGVFGALYILAIGKNEELTGDYDELYIDYLELSIEFNSLDNQYFILTGEHIELENDYNILVIALSDMTTERDALETDLITMTAERDVLIVDLANMTTERNNLLDQIDTLNGEIIVHLATISGLNSLIGVLEAKIFVLEQQAIIDTETIDDLNIQIGDLNADISIHLNTIADLEATIDARDDTIIDLNTQINILNGEIISLGTQIDDLNDYIAFLNGELNNLWDIYYTLMGDYQILFDANEDLENTYNTLLLAYNYVTDIIRQSILPVQYSIFAEAVRRYYAPIYMEGLSGKDYWIAFAEFCRDIILHDSMWENSFTEVSNAFSDCLMAGNDTMTLAWYIMYFTFYPWLPNWLGYGLTGNELTDIDTIVDWCIDEIDYEYDSEITIGQEYFDWDYIKFPVETAFRTFGDCEDQAILTAAYLESCGFETAILINHDPSHPIYGEFYHGTFWVYIDDPIAFWSLYPDTDLWTIDGGATLWCWVDTTWDVPFGSTPAWLQDYIDYNIPLSWDIITLAFCDIDGTVNTNEGEKLGLTYVMPT